jgi:hypothetical protein
LQIDHTVEVRAPAPVVWTVVTDLARYPEWNPFVVACASDLAVGSPIDMRVRLVGGFAQRQRETILSHEPGRRLCYGLASAFLGALSSSRCHHVESLGPERARYESRFALQGPLEPVVRALLGRALRSGFSAMTDALVHRAEELAHRPAGALP